MKFFYIRPAFFVLTTIFSWFLPSPPQNPQTSNRHEPLPSATPVEAAEEMSDLEGVYIRGASWTEVLSVMPTSTRLKHVALYSLTYGAVPAASVAEYDGAHAEVRIPAGRLLICVCNVALPQNLQPIIVRLHIKKNMRVLDAGKLHMFVGAKILQASHKDLVAMDALHSDNMVWLAQPRQPLAPGEYAVLLGSENMEIFPFTVVEKPKDSGTTK